MAIVNLPFEGYRTLSGFDTRYYVETAEINLLKDGETYLQGFAEFNESTINKNTIVKSAKMTVNFNVLYSSAPTQTIDFLGTPVKTLVKYPATQQNPQSWAITYDGADIGILWNFKYSTSNLPNSIEIDMTNYMRSVVSSGKPFKGVHLFMRAGNDHTISATFSDLEIEYDTAPTKPVVTFPNGGELISSNQTFTWSDASDDDTPTANLKYQVQLSTNNGSTWNTLIALTAAGVTSYPYVFSESINSNLCKIRVRAYDGFLYGDWDESDGVFTIAKNVAPSIPTIQSPSGNIVDVNKVVILKWMHNDLNTNDSQSKADIRWRVQDATLWNTVTSSGSEQQYIINSNVIPTGQIEWQVMTYDQASLPSPWSNVAVFSSAEATNAPVITQPTNPASVQRPVIEWTNTAQQSYQIVIEDSFGAILWDTGEVVSTVKARTVGIDLINGATYKIKLRIKDAGGLFSSFAEKTITVSYTPPAKPILTAFTANGFIALNIGIPTPTGTEPTVVSHEVYKKIGGIWTRVAYGINTEFNDYHVRSGQEYEYYAKAIAVNGTTSNSDIVSQAVTFSGSWIHTIQDAEATLQYFRYNGTGYEDAYEPESAVLKFAGRTRPVVHFGAYEDYSLTVTIQSVEGMSDMDVLRGFVRNREAICYRDTDGNLIVGYLLSLVTSKEYRVSSATITIVETDFTEGV